MNIALSFIHLAFIGFVALFPPVNPIGTALAVEPLLHGLVFSKRRAAAFKIAFYCFTICGGTILMGSWLFKLFGISIPVVQVAGGIMICKMGWQFLSSDDTVKDTESAPEELEKNVDDILFYPLAFPMTTGAGTISVLLTLSAHGNSGENPDYFLNLTALFVAVLAMSAAIYISYAFTPALLKHIGKGGQQVMNRLSAFLVFCVGIQIGVEGITHLITKF